MCGDARDPLDDVLKQLQAELDHRQETFDLMARRAQILVNQWPASLSGLIREYNPKMRHLNVGFTPVDNSMSGSGWEANRLTVSLARAGLDRMNVIEKILFRVTETARLEIAPSCADTVTVDWPSDDKFPDLITRETLANAVYRACRPKPAV